MMGSMLCALILPNQQYYLQQRNQFKSTVYQPWLKLALPVIPALWSQCGYVKPEWCSKTSRKTQILTHLKSQCNKQQQLFFCIMKYSVMDYWKRKICRAWTWLSPLVVNWMEADVNASLQSVIRNRRCLSRLHVNQSIFNYLSLPGCIPYKMICLTGF